MRSLLWTRLAALLPITEPEDFRFCEYQAQSLPPQIWSFCLLFLLCVCAYACAHTHTRKSGRDGSSWSGLPIPLSLLYTMKPCDFFHHVQLVPPGLPLRDGVPRNDERLWILQMRITFQMGWILTGEVGHERSWILCLFLLLVKP